MPDDKNCTCSDCVNKRKKPDGEMAKSHPYVREGEEVLKK